METLSIMCDKCFISHHVIRVRKSLYTTIDKMHSVIVLHLVMLCTCPVAGVVQINSEGPRLMLGLPGGRGAVLVVGVGVVVMGVLSRQHGGAGRTAHGRGDERVGEVGPTLFHDPPGLIHDLHRTWTRERECVISS